ncbi:MAG: hypothetical protein KJN99_04305 [Marinicaulis sp.]|nr:hypothetical protein [Marinicaulis sp.]
MPSRRIILTTGAAAIVVAGAGWVLSRQPKLARAPWRDAGESFGDPRLDALAYAVLAPNPHNMQPWRVELTGEREILLFCDQSRLLPETDPPNRQITIGFGCFIELFRNAAAHKGFYAQVTPFPDGEPQPTLDNRPVAHIELKMGERVVYDALFSECMARRTNRARFDTDRGLSEEQKVEIQTAAIAGNTAFVIDDPGLRAELRALTKEAFQLEWNLARTRRESVHVTRIGKNAINEKPYGIALAGPLMDALGGFGMVTNDKMDTPGETAYEQSISFYDKACDSAMAYAVIKTPTNSRVDQLNTGRDWVRMQLAATHVGVAFHPLSQALQEFPEMASHYAHVHELLGANNGETVQMLSRLGFAKSPPPAPREALMSKIVGV